ncbi:hypothetical protein [Clostridium oryzae]|uniref:DUF5704 domain-containing protein n=1 Tax=Clostridium oryzae TaxID=1450648 RepID=A0A1V4IIM1_9CLOT|nr:hypothetical protein [Clostridium oryzae]OPJ59776.1 hypothetical protein CLORY_31210 [Clostridium oryzae]
MKKIIDIDVIRRMLCVLLVFLFLIPMIKVKKVQAIDIDPKDFYYKHNNHIAYDSNSGQIIYANFGGKAHSGSHTFYRTLGFQVVVYRKISDSKTKAYYCRFKLGSNYLKQIKSKTVGSKIYMLWGLSLNSGKKNLISYLKSHFNEPSDKSTFESIPSKGTTGFNLNAIMTINEERDGVDHILGRMDDDGDVHGKVFLTYNGNTFYQTKKVDKAKSTWEYVRDEDKHTGPNRMKGICGYTGWPAQSITALKTYFNIQLTISSSDIPVKRTVKIYYKDDTTHQNIWPCKSYKTVTVKDKSVSVKDVPYKKISRYTFVESALRYDGKHFTSMVKGDDGKERTIKVDKTHKTFHVVFFYKSKPTKPPGAIIFIPDSTDWTNKGKIIEGKGKYKVKVSYKGNNPIITKESVKFTHEEKDKKGKVTTSTYNQDVYLSWPIEKIIVTGNGKTGDLNKTIDDTEGYIYLDHEGDEQSLQGKGVYGEPIVSWPTTSDKHDSLQKTKPKAPAGDGGEYALDWTKPKINITPLPEKKWINQDPYDINVTVSDELSGIDDDKSKLTVEDKSHYGNKIFNAPENDGDENDGDEGTIDDGDQGDTGTSDDESDYSGSGDTYDDDDNVNYENVYDDFNQNISLNQDGMYHFDVNATDNATNENSEKKETYLIDRTQPDVDFSVGPGIFSENNGAVRKESKKGSDFAYYGTLTFSDNLSGVASVGYYWSYEGDSNNNDGDNADGSEGFVPNIAVESENYETIYTSSYTVTDRYGEIKRDDNGDTTGTDGEIHNSEIEKPVGDHLYLHVKEVDTAGNETDATFGPYEDPIKMRNFEITDIRDPLWDSVFWKDSNYTEPTGKTYKANELPIDNNSHPSIKSAAPKLGYSFYFDMTTEFLYRDQDRIEIQPSFYYWDGKTRVPVDVYYNLNNNQLTKLGSKQDTQTLGLNTARYGNVLIGCLPQLTLTKGVRIAKGREWNDWKGTIQYSDGKIQWWYGKYFLPATSVFVKQGQKPRTENLLRDKNIIINFDIVAYKNGIETLSSDQQFYYSPNQWQTEGSPKSSEYEPGDVMVYDNKHTVLSNYRAFIIQ